jgi:hypothetical protein
LACHAVPAAADDLRRLGAPALHRMLQSSGRGTA